MVWRDTICIQLMFSGPRASNCCASTHAVASTRAPLAAGLCIVLAALYTASSSWSVCSSSDRRLV
jgi:hypothetical protein